MVSPPRTAEGASIEYPHPKSRFVIHPRQTVTLRLPGGGGFYSPLKRDPAPVLEDVKQGYVSLKCAEEKYGVVINERSMAVDEERTKEERLKRATFQSRY
jgi:N-methylhydantoinase B